MLYYSWFARRHNWHPRQVDELSLDEVEWLPVIEEGAQSAAETISKQEQAQNKANRW